MRPRRRWLRRIALTLLVLYGVVLTFGRLPDRILMHPSTHHIEARGAQRRELPGAGGGPLEFWVVRSPGAVSAGAADVIVLEFCGNATRAEQIAEYRAAVWGERPVEVWVMNHPGYGGSAGAARLSALPAAALGAYDGVAASIASGRPIILAGNSLGSTMALHVAANRPHAALVLTNPPPLRKVLMGRYGWWNAWLLAVPVALGVPAELDSLANAARTKSPALFVQGTQDRLVPPAYQDPVIAAYAGSKSVLRLNMGHVDFAPPEEEPALRAALADLYVKALGAPR
jgi:pimeloyl-ACP methyl ester carboxylesterase